MKAISCVGVYSVFQHFMALGSKLTNTLYAADFSEVSVEVLQKQ